MENCAAGNTFGFKCFYQPGVGVAGRQLSG